MDHTVDAAGRQGVQRTKIPTVLSSFVGRKRELAELQRLLSATRLLTLTGAAGCGKTRLALRLAWSTERRYPDGAVWVDLAELRDPTLVSQSVARALDVSEQPGSTTIESLVDALHQKQLLLVLDNCEHLVSACASLIEELLSRSDLTVLATSRQPLSIAAEHRYPVPPLSLPPSSVGPDELSHFDATHLFVERARAILPTFSLTSENSGFVASVCQRLDGIPLAIELASARVNVLTVEQIAQRLSDRFELLGGASPVVRTHHRTMYAAIDWSYELLTPPEQALLRRLCVFAGGCVLDSVERVCVAEPLTHEDLLDTMTSLVDKSLVNAHTLGRGDARYTVLETIREYGLEKLRAAGELAKFRDRHLQYFLQVTEETAPKLAGRYQRLWVDWLEAESDNLRSALGWAMTIRQVESGLRITIALYQFWTIRDYVVEGLRWTNQLLDVASDEVPLVTRANALAYSALMAGFRGDTDAQVAYGRKAASLAERAGSKDARARAWALAAQAHAARAMEDFETEFKIANQVIQIYRDLEDRHLTGIGLTAYSTIPMLLGDLDRARAMLDEGIPLLRESGDPYRIAMALNFSGDLWRCEYDYARAIASYTESVSLLRDCGAVRDLASVLHNLGHARLHRRDIHRAMANIRESMDIHESQGNTRGMAECLIGFAAAAILIGLPGAGTRLLAAAVSIGGQSVASAWPATRMEYEHYLALARAGLTEQEFQAEQATGQSMRMQQAVKYARQLRVDEGVARATRHHPDELSVREREVAEYIARGRSNQEIADELSLSKRTIEKHIANILSKLAVSNRAEIVRRVLESATDRSPQ